MRSPQVSRAWLVQFRPQPGSFQASRPRAVRLAWCSSLLFGCCFYLARLDEAAVWLPEWSSAECLFPSTARSRSHHPSQAPGKRGKFWYPRSQARKRFFACSGPGAVAASSNQSSGGWIRRACRRKPISPQISLFIIMFWKARFNCRCSVMI